MYRKKLIMLLTIFVLAPITVACSNTSTSNNNEQENNMTESNQAENDMAEDNVNENNSSTNNDDDASEEEDEQADLALTKLLPYQSGYVWKYDGAIEYGHVMELITIEEAAEKATYIVEGEVDDMSGGE